jgi:hypothetical protein
LNSGCLALNFNNMRKRSHFYEMPALFFAFAPFLLCAQSTNISTNFNQASAATDNCGTTNVKVYGFQANVFGFSSPSFTDITNFTTSGTYTASDILNFKLYSTPSTTFNTSSLVATISTGLGTGNHTFTGFNFGLPFSGGGTQTYFWITVDISATAVNGRTLTCQSLNGLLTISGSVSYGTVSAGGTQTISCISTPIELLSFTGYPSGRGNALSWTTATEINNDLFSVERSGEGSVFETILVVKGAGNSNVLVQYAAMDRDPLPGMNYYRLRQTDYDGNYTYSEIIAVEEKNSNMLLYPVPASGKLYVSIPVVSERSALTITDGAGRVCCSFEQEVGSNILVMFDLEDLPAGIYIVYSNELNFHRKFYKL